MCAGSCLPGCLHCRSCHRTHTRWHQTASGQHPEVNRTKSISKAHRWQWEAVNGHQCFHPSSSRGFTYDDELIISLSLFIHISLLPGSPLFSSRGNGVAKGRGGAAIHWRGLSCLPLGPTGRKEHIKCINTPVYSMWSYYYSTMCETVNNFLPGGQ